MIGYISDPPSARRRQIGVSAEARAAIAAARASRGAP